jgi:hypothetical protein
MDDFHDLIRLVENLELNVEDFELPNEMWMMIFGYCDVKTLTQCLMACANWRALVEKIFLNEDLFKDEFLKWWDDEEGVIKLRNSWKDCYFKYQTQRKKLRESGLSDNVIEKAKNDLEWVEGDLQSVFFSTWRFYSLPKSMFNYSSIKIVNLGYNGMTLIPLELLNLLELEVLILSNNEIPEIPVELFNLKNLKELRVDKNKLIEIPVEINQCKTLKTLIVGDNPLLKDLPKMSNLKNLKTLGISKMQSLTISNIENCKKINLFYAVETSWKIIRPLMNLFPNAQFVM